MTEFQRSPGITESPVRGYAKGAPTKGVVVHHGDSREVLQSFAADSIDSVVCDPPYALISIGKRFGVEGAAACKPGKTGAYARASAGFMGKRWDTGETAFDPAFWVEVLRVLKPGGHVVAFGGTRTYHRLVCAIEDAGFEIRDQLAWLYGSGFPKSHDVSKGIDRAAGASRQVVGRNPNWRDPEVNAQHHKRWNEAVVTGEITAPATDEAARWQGWGTALKPALEPIVLARKPLCGTVAATVLAHGCGALNVDACRVETAEDLNGGAYAERSGAKGGVAWASNHDRVTGKAYAQPVGRWPANVIRDGSAEVLKAFPESESGGHPPAGGMRSRVSTYGEPNARGEPQFGSSGGSAARFFYSAKADAEDRLGSKHPTVKPVDLMAWLCRLVTPPGGTVLDPFAGTGTTGLAAMREGFDCILIERETEYVADIERRLAWARGEGRLTAQEIGRHKQAPCDGPLFDDVA